MKKELYYQCPQCGDVVTKTWIMNGMKNGVIGMCYCDYLEKKVMYKYKKISKEDYHKFLNIIKNPFITT